MINISYNAWKDYRECPKKYYLKNRKRQPPSVPRNDYYTLYGKLTEKFFQMFCNIWRFNSPYMFPEDIQNKLKILYEGVLNSSVVNWDAPFVQSTKEDIFNQSYGDICAIMDSQNQNYFLNTKSEITVEIATKDNICIKGRLDFIHNDVLSKTITIFDGKGSSNIGKNVENNQVLFYALLYFLHFKIMPEQLGFFYYRFNTFKPVPITLDILNEFRAKLSLDIKKILGDSTYIATPCSKSCKYCDYRITCMEGLEDQGKRKKESKLDFPDQDGIIEIGI
jgi:CRISPR/Cas system-associated exonuclease Cas4 (RecB family)